MHRLTTAILCLALTLTTVRMRGAEAATLPNIVFILADDLGYGDLGCYGAEKIKTPNIDRLAEEGILFTDGHCGASTCTPTRYGLMTGRHAWRSWCKYSALSTNAPLLIEEERVTIASFLKSAGYRTSIVGKWHLGYGHEEHFAKDRGDAPPNYWNTRGTGPNWNGELKPGPRENGFDYSYVIPVANSFPPYVFIENYRVAGLRKDSPIGRLQSQNFGTMEGGEGARWKDEELIDQFTDKLVSQLEGFASTRQPFFLYYPPSHPHIGSRRVRGNSHWPNARFKNTSQAGNYGDVVQELDWSVGVILDTLDRLGLSENTLVIFTSDNGGYTRSFHGHLPNGHILRGGKGDLVEGGIRVPFLAKWPGKIKPGTRSQEIISTTDMLATVAAIVGQALPKNAGPDSYNVLPALLGKKLAHPERPVVLSSGGTGAISIRSGQWKLIDGQGNCGYGEFQRKQPWPTPPKDAPPAQLYNLSEDLRETRNLYLQHPEIVYRLKTTLEKIKNDEHYRPTELAPSPKKLSVAQVNALFAEPEKPAQQQATLVKIGGRIARVSSSQRGHEAACMLDGDPSTFWHTRFTPSDAKAPHFVILQLPLGTRVTGLSYTAWSGGNANGHVRKYTVSVSEDGQQWTAPQYSGELKPRFSGKQSIPFSSPITQPFIRLDILATESPTNRFLAAIGELDVLVEHAPPKPQ